MSIAYIGKGWFQQKHEYITKKMIRLCYKSETFIR